MLGKKFLPGSTDEISLSTSTSGTGTAIPLNDCRQTEWNTEYSGTITGGTIIVECASTPTFAGTWKQLDSFLAVDVVAGTAGMGTFPGSPGGFTRFRVDSGSPITGGGTITGRVNGLLN